MSVATVMQKATKTVLLTEVRRLESSDVMIASPFSRRPPWRGFPTAPVLPLEPRGERRIEGQGGARYHVPSREGQSEDAKLHLVAIDNLVSVRGVEKILDVDRARERSRAGGRAKPPMLFPPCQ